MKPLIGVTAEEIKNQIRPWGPTLHGQNHTYADAIIRAGGIPVIVPLTTDRSVLHELNQRLDGLLLAGGRDINPRLYKQKPAPTTDAASDLRDSTEIYLLQQALDNQKPVLAICRGMQLLNVACGGNLYQDIATELKTAVDHQSSTRAKDHAHLAHALRIEPESKLASVLGIHHIDANSHHHQAVKRLGNGLAAVAWTEDGIIEAIESIDDSFVFGIQAHPESLEAKAEPQWQKLFGAFVRTAQATLAEQPELEPEWSWAS